MTSVCSTHWYVSSSELMIFRDPQILCGYNHETHGHPGGPRNIAALSLSALITWYGGIRASIQQRQVGNIRTKSCKIWFINKTILWIMHWQPLARKLYQTFVAEENRCRPQLLSTLMNLCQKLMTVDVYRSASRTVSTTMTAAASLKRNFKFRSWMRQRLPRRHGQKYRMPQSGSGCENWVRLFPS